MNGRPGKSWATNSCGSSRAALRPSRRSARDRPPHRGQRNPTLTIVDQRPLLRALVAQPVVFHLPLLLSCANKWWNRGLSRFCHAIRFDQKQPALPESEKWLVTLCVGAMTEHDVTAFRSLETPAFATFQHPIAKGGVAFTDESGDLWFEEYIVSPPTHILNGFIWALWGVHDFALATKEAAAQELFGRGVRTLLHNLDRYDLGFWSLYEQSGMRLPMVTSAFYHRLHIVQLRVMHHLTGEELFARVADRWEGYTRSRVNRARALGYTSAFKLCYY